MMHTEFELKFLGIDHDDLQHKIITHGGVMISPITLMRRLIFDLPGEGEFIRVRDEGQQITMSYKKMNNYAIDGTQEINIIVNNFDDAVSLLENTGLKRTAYQESYRTMYELNGCEICFDLRPGLQEYCEIEGPTQQKVEDCINKLGLDLTQGIGGTVNRIYQQELGFEPNELETINELTFANPPQSKL